MRRLAGPTILGETNEWLAIPFTEKRGMCLSRLTARGQSYVFSYHETASGVFNRVLCLQLVPNLFPWSNKP